MQTFEIKEDFLLNNRPFKIISGAIHYFRIPRSQWEDSLYNLKALGANTVETYIPWNVHEPEEGSFNFEGMLDIEAFVQLAQQMGLYVILRPSVYICGEWEFGGLPAWLLRYKGIRLRSTDEVFMSKVAQYYSVLLPRLVPLQITQGGPVLMMQIENEYGSYGMDKAYLRQTRDLMEQQGINVPLFTSDGAWEEALSAGGLIEDDILVTGNFGSKVKENTDNLRKHMNNYGKKWPIMCMEFWDGWFNRWGEDIIHREAEDLAEDVKAMLEIGSLNLYMFHGGTNFGFYNGCSARGRTDLPQITSYDYDALLNEAGEPTPKYYAVQRAIKEVCPDVWQAAPRTKSIQNLGSYTIQERVSLFSVLSDIAQPIHSDYPLTMEEAGSGYGYQLYSVSMDNLRPANKVKAIEAGDRLKFYSDERYVTTHYQDNMEEEVALSGLEKKIQLDILVENMGRVNYGYKLNNPTQSKGLRNGLMHDIHFVQGYSQYILDLSGEQVAKINFDKPSVEGQPTFNRVAFNLLEVHDTYIDCSSYGKGVIIINGFNLGRYWNVGPTYSLYCPKDFLQIGVNEVIVFETEGIEINAVNFSSVPV